MQVAYFHYGPHQPGDLLFLFHHVIIDAYSLQLVLRDFQTIYHSLQRQEPISLPPKTTSLKLLGERLAQFVAAPSVQRELEEYWLKLPWHEVASLPVDFPERRTANTFGSLNKVTGICSQEETANLLSKGKASGTSILEMLVAAALKSLAGWIETRPVVLGIIDHGREALFDEIDLSNTVGSLIGARWFPLRLPESLAPNDVLRAVKHQMRELPNRGSTYSLQRLLSNEQALLARLRDLPHHEIEFNYLGDQDSLDDEPLFAPPEYEPEELDWWEDPGETNSYLISFTSFLAQGQLNVVCRYSKNLYRQETIDAILQRFLETLAQIAS
jgi:non-ribosomal peptide synthase protein (TIGR01720 family)